MLNDLALSAGLINIGTAWLLDQNGLVPSWAGQRTRQSVSIWPKQQVKFPSLSSVAQTFSFMSVKKCHIQGRKQSQKIKPREFFSKGIHSITWVLNRRDWKYRWRFLLSVPAEIWAPGYGFQKAISTGDEMLSLSKQGFFFHRWLAGNLASRCWVIGSHKSANPAFPPIHTCFTITVMSAEAECD